MKRYYFEIDPGQSFNVFFGPLWRSVKDEFPESALAQRPENWFYRSKFGTVPQSPTADTNLTNPVMINWVIDFSKFWINKGIDGFRIDVAPYSQISRQIDGTFVNNVDPNDVINQTIIRKLRQIKPDLFLYAEEFAAGLNVDGTVNDIELGVLMDGGKTFGASTNYQLASLFYDLIAGIDVYGASHPDALLNGELFINEYLNKILPEVSKNTDVTFVENHDLQRFITLVTVPASDQPTVTLTPPSSFAPAPAGSFRIHYDAASLPPALQNNNMNLYYFTYSGSCASNPFAAGSVNNLDTPPGNPFCGFLGGGNDAFGPYWDFPISYLQEPPQNNLVFGFIVIQKSGLVKITNNINIDTAIATTVVNAGSGDIFVSGVPVPTGFPTQDQLNQVQTAYGLLFSLPGSPFIWQGQEQGMQGVNGDSTRESVVWSSAGSQVKGFSPYIFPSGIAPAGYENIFSTQFTVRPPDQSNPLWTFMRTAINARKNSPALKQGTITKLTLPGNRETDVVTIFDQGSDTVTTRDLVAFTRTFNNWPVYCIFNFGETPKQVEVRGGLLYSCNIEFLANVANLPPQIYFSNNISTSNVANPGCEPYIISMPQFSGVVFTPIAFFGIPNGDLFQNLPACCI